ncbi:hypothetical protein HG535_0A00330 [Zygotorulaspora mrakii]|uniref:Laminarase-resistance protein LRE1 n=1 Tax=Zygotorulaspora mrakii TaxID=42260 RepID=A0A7H9AVB9_ZYGMR|nr:uncharacterized protein HG535_0A00330 [Zygotorulaspora mrakii]QLG70093.1 hypothetical protein HG535_0A00330 [Zygotorulaspora mrakii]
MTDTQHLLVADALPIENSTTPSKKGHRHKRSFAISGDFDFLKQPGTVPPMICSSPGSATTNSYTHNIQTGQRQEDNYSCPSEAMPRSPFKLSNQASNLSPRFFISEEPKFSSPFRGVPDAIINLDDALKAKPRSFKNHKRSESAPPDLAILLNSKNSTSGTVMIEEEDDESPTNSDSSGSSNTEKDTVFPSLISPLRPQSPTPNPHNYDMNGSPVQSKNTGYTSNSSKVNTLKINGQKQRYHYYTKKLSINAISNVEPQSLKEKGSFGSLSSGVNRTPLSTACTPLMQISTPSTPVSLNNNNAIFNAYKYEGFEKGPISPVRVHRSSVYNNRNMTQQNHNNNSKKNTNATFKYESISYDIPQEPNKCDSVSSRDDKTLMKKDIIFQDDGDVTGSIKQDDAKLELSPYEEQRNENVLSKEILFGEPGDAVDLSTLPSSRRSSNENREPLSKQEMAPIMQVTSFVKESRSRGFEASQDSRSVSDSILLTGGRPHRHKKTVKSKLNNFFANFFSKSSNESNLSEKKP